MELFDLLDVAAEHPPAPARWRQQVVVRRRIFLSAVQSRGPGQLIKLAGAHGGLFARGGPAAPAMEVALASRRNR